MGGEAFRKCVVCSTRLTTKKKGGTLKYDVFMAKFPLDENRCKQWVQAVGDPDLVYVPIEKLHQLRYVCSAHFRKKYINKKGSRFKKNAVPSENMQAPPLSDDQIKDFPFHVFVRREEMSGVTISNIMVTGPQNLPSRSDNVPASHIMATMEENTKKKKENKNLLQKATTSYDKENISDNVPASHIMATMEENTKKKKENKNLLQKATTSYDKENISDNVPASHIMATLEENTKKKKENKNLLQKATTSYDKENIMLSPRKKKLVEKLKKTKCTLASLRKSAQLVENIESPVLKEIVISALKNQKRKPQGRRWTSANKIAALAVMKRSPKGYKYLQSVLPLPSIKTLQNVLKKVPVEPGINCAVLKHLMTIAPDLEQNNKLCSLLFDEMALKPRAIYNEAIDQIDGYTDSGNRPEEQGRSAELADHALVFMMQGLRQKIIQPVAFFFVKGTISTAKLSVLIKEVIRAITSTGFEIIATVCDQGSTNIGALNVLKNNDGFPKNSNFFILDSQKVFTIYDVPHLIKSVRNNFYKNGNMFFNNRFGNWAHILQVEEKNRLSFLYLSKLTKNHGQPMYRAKMKVKYAAQILSNTVAAILILMSEAHKGTDYEKELLDTAMIIKEMDKLFDFTNGPSCPKDVKKGLRENVSLKTDHLNVWADFRKKMENCKFIDSKKETEATNVKCVKGYMTTLSSLQDVWNLVRGRGFKYMNLRQLNQDSLENLFGIIRQHSPTNRNPTCSHFMGALKSALISSMTITHSRGSNCEKDGNKLLMNFRDLVFRVDEGDKLVPNENYNSNNGCDVESALNDIPVLCLPGEDGDDISQTETNLADIENQSLVYVGGYIASTLLKKHKCDMCLKCLTIKDPGNDPIYSYIRLREWWTDKNSLTYPSIHLCQIIQSAVEIFEKDVCPQLHRKNICQFIITLFYTKFNMTWMNCPTHGQEITKKLFIRISILFVRRECQRINQEILSREEQLADANKKSQQLGIAKYPK